NEVASNSLRNNGFFGNPTNSDLAAATMLHDPGNCFHDNTDPNGVTSDPPDIQNPAVMGTCGVPNAGDTTVLAAELVCASSVFGTCPDVPGAGGRQSPGGPGPCPDEEGVPEDRPAAGDGSAHTGRSERPTDGCHCSRVRQQRAVDRRGGGLEGAVGLGEAGAIASGGVVGTGEYGLGGRASAPHGLGDAFALEGVDEAC